MSANSIKSRNADTLDGQHAPTGTIVGTTDTQTLTNKTLTSPLFIGSIDGWISANETWTYASSTTITISGDKTNTYQVGDRLKLTQTTVKYFRITAISYSAPNTTVTVSGLVLYSVANAAITSPYYSKMDNPQGFPQKEVTLFNGTAAASITLSETSANFDRLLIFYLQDSRVFSTTLLVGSPIAVVIAIQGYFDSAYRIRIGAANITASGTTLSVGGSGANYSTDTTSASAVTFYDTKIIPTIKKVIGYRW